MKFDEINNTIEKYRHYATSKNVQSANRRISNIRKRVLLFERTMKGLT